GRGNRRHPKVWWNGGTGRALYADPALANGAETRWLAGDLVPRGNVDRDSNGKLSGGAGKSAGAGAVPASYRLERRQLWLTSVDINDSRHGTGRSDVARLVASDESRSASRAFIGRDSWSDRCRPRRRMGHRRRTIFPSTAVWPALAPRRAHSRYSTRRCRAMGNTFRIHASVPSAQSRG